MARRPDALSVLEDMGESVSGCGYCRAEGGTSISHGMWAHRLTVHDYQELVDRGWRRSGCWLYKPDIARTCCPQYTIRLEAARFAPSREQRRLQRRLAAYAAGTLALPGDAVDAAGAARAAHAGPDAPASPDAGKRAGGGAAASKGTSADAQAAALAAAVAAAVRARVDAGELPAAAHYPPPQVAPPAPRVAARLPPGTVFTCAAPLAVAAAAAASASASGAAPPATAAQLAAQLAAELSRPGALPSPSLRCHVSGAGYLNFVDEATAAATTTSAAHAAAPPARPARKERRRSEPTAAAAAAAAAAPPPLPLPAPQRDLAARTLEVRTAPSSFVDPEFELYRRYQVAVHGDAPEELTEAGYTRFLVDTPLVHVPPSATSAAPACGLGSLHTQYWLGGRLAFVGVVDALPRCLSSKYLFWDPALAELGLGKISALLEIDWVAAQSAPGGPCPSLRYYYLGFYIHSCAKMRYKAQYKPSQLLCPATRRWVPFEDALPALDAAGPAPRQPRLAPPGEDGDGAAEATLGDVALDSCQLLFPGRGVARLGALPPELRAAQAPALARFAAAVGPVVARRAVAVCWTEARPEAMQEASGTSDDEAA